MIDQTLKVFPAVAILVLSIQIPHRVCFARTRNNYDDEKTNLATVSYVVKARLESDWHV